MDVYTIILPMKAKFIEQGSTYVTYYPDNNHLQITLVAWTEVITIETFNSKMGLTTKHVYYNKEKLNHESQTR